MIKQMATTGHLPRLTRSQPWRMAELAAMAVLLVASTAWHMPVSAQAAAPAAKSSVAAGVTVSVTPAQFTSSEWSFKVVLDTHSQTLDDDLLKTAVLVVDGVELHPGVWAAPAGGHHREGLLGFSAPSQRPAKVELRITRPNESEPRVFRWDGVPQP